MSKKMVLIDGHSILNRAFYGVPDLSNAQGLHTNAVYGFLNIMFKILEEEKPEFLAVAFDVHAPTFRHELYKEYKGTRKPMPEELREQVPVIKEVLQAMGICTVEKAGLEADDILGTLAKRGEKEGMEVALVSGDRDLLQIASDHIKIRIPKTKGGKTEIEDYYASDVEDAYQVTPEQFIELKALMGDSSDNIPGVPKVGPKTATDLMVQYGSLENIYTHLDEISKKSIRESLAENKELADLSKVLATIHTDCELDVTWDMVSMQALFTPEAYTLFKQLEFKNLLGRFEEEAVTKNNQKDFFFMTSDLQEAEAAFEEAGKAERAAFLVLEDSGREEDFAALALAAASDKIWILRPQGFLTKEYLTDKLAALAQRGAELSTFQIKPQYAYLKQDGTEQFFDVLIAAYLLNPLKNDYSIEDIANEQLGLMIQSRQQLLEKLPLAKAAGEREEAFREYAGFAVYTIFMAQPLLWGKLQETQMDKLFCEIEMPLTKVLHEMETEGVEVRPEELKAYGDALVDRITELEDSIHRQAGEDFNINSPKQLGEILFEKMKLPGGKKTKTGYSTAADVLDKLAPDYPVVSEILEYRGLTKLKSTYADGRRFISGKTTGFIPHLTRLSRQPAESAPRNRICRIFLCEWSWEGLSGRFLCRRKAICLPMRIILR